MQTCSNSASKHTFRGLRARASLKLVAHRLHVHPMPEPPFPRENAQTTSLEAARPVLAAVGRKINRLGPVGAGATWKLINNQLIAAQIAALAEALDVAVKAGFGREQIADLILAGAAASPIVKMKLPRMIARDFEATDFALYLMLKDTRSAAALAQSLGAPAYMVSGATRAFARAEAEGLGDKDFSAVAG